MTRIRRTPQQEQERRSVHQFCDFLEDYEWNTGEIHPDMGEDILVQIYDEGISTGLSLYFQLKSTEDIDKHKLKSGEISYQFEVKDIEHWEAQTVPVFLCLWDISLRQGWWIWIKHAVEYLDENNPTWKSKKKVNVHIPLKNEVNEQGLKGIRHLVADLYYPIFSHGKEFKIQTKFEFPQTPEGEQKKAEFERHVAAGDAVVIGEEYIAEIKFPEWWTRRFGILESQDMYLEMGVIQSTEVKPALLEFSSPGYETVSFPYIEFKTIKQGTQEITISNEQQDMPFKFQLTLNKQTQQYNFNFTTHFDDISVENALKFLNFQQILANGGTFKLEILKTGDKATFPIPKGSYEPPKQKTLDFVEKAFFIQNELGIELKFPEDGSFSHLDAMAVDEIISIIEKGSYQQSGMVFNVDLKKPGVEQIVKDRVENAPVHFRLISPDSFVELLSRKIEFGPMIQKIKGQMELSLDEIHEWLGQAEEDDSLNIRVVNAEVHEEFESWPRKNGAE